MIVTGDQLRPALQLAVEAELSPAARFIGVVTDGQLRGVFGIDGWTGEDCEAFMAGRPTRELLRVVSEYCFGMLACSRITCRVLETNAPMVALIERLGFTAEGRLRKALNGRDVLIFGMLKEECPWARNQQRCQTLPIRQ